MTIVNDDSSVVIKWSFKFIDAARGVIYDHHMFIVQTTDPKIEGFESPTGTRREKVAEIFVF